MPTDRGDGRAVEPAQDNHEPWVRRAGEEWPRAAKVAGSTVAMLLDSSVPGADLYGGINVLAPGAQIPAHWHSMGELQFILSGTGEALDARGGRVPVAPHGVVFSPAGSAGGHGFVNTGLVPLAILFVYPSPGGLAPDFNLLEPANG
ncbi:MAG: cupin domain-containing protein [Chloroflexi bacterium]|nr:cupin domain-containing protein [Chloroflexota bacterium]